MRTSRPHRLVERRLAWSAGKQAAAGLQGFDTKPLAWEVLRRHRPPRTGRSQLPQRLRREALQRLGTPATKPRPRRLLLPTSAAGRRGRDVVRLKRTAIDSARRRRREQGNGRKDRAPRLSPRVLTAR